MSDDVKKFLKKVKSKKVNLDDKHMVDKAAKLGFVDVEKSKYGFKVTLTKHGKDTLKENQIDYVSHILKEAKSNYKVGDTTKNDKGETVTLTDIGDDIVIYKKEDGTEGTMKRDSID